MSLTNVSRSLWLGIWDEIFYSFLIPSPQPHLKSSLRQANTFFLSQASHLIKMPVFGVWGPSSTLGFLLSFLIQVCPPPTWHFMCGPLITRLWYIRIAILVLDYFFSVDTGLLDFENSP